MVRGAAFPAPASLQPAMEPTPSTLRVSAALQGSEDLPVRVKLPITDSFEDAAVVLRKVLELPRDAPVSVRVGIELVRRVQDLEEGERLLVTVLPPAVKHDAGPSGASAATADQPAAATRANKRSRTASALFSPPPKEAKPRRRGAAAAKFVAKPEAPQGLPPPLPPPQVAAGYTGTVTLRPGPGGGAPAVYTDLDAALRAAQGGDEHLGSGVMLATDQLALREKNVRLLGGHPGYLTIMHPDGGTSIRTSLLRVCADGVTIAKCRLLAKGRLALGRHILEVMRGPKALS